MRLEDLSPAHVRRALEIYLERAFPQADRPGGAKPRLGCEHLEGVTTLDEVLARFEHPPASEERSLRRWTLRLGNEHYPFMKFVLQEYLVNGEFFFSVDTHDNLEVRPDNPDYARWQALKHRNRGMREAIEADWRRAGLPTHEDLRVLAEELAHVEGEGGRRGRLLVVDDEVDVARGVEALLSARGYDVELAFGGEVALERLSRDPLPDLVLLDYELPDLDGEEIARRMRLDPRLERVPILMATAASIELGRLRRVSGLLRKPYTRELLYRMVARLLDPEPPHHPAGETGEPRAEPSDEPSPAREG